MKVIKKTKERILSFVLTFVLVLSLLTGMTPTNVHAEEWTPTEEELNAVKSDVISTLKDITLVKNGNNWECSSTLPEVKGPHYKWVYVYLSDYKTTSSYYKDSVIGDVRVYQYSAIGKKVGEGTGLPTRDDGGPQKPVEITSLNNFQFPAIDNYGFLAIAQIYDWDTSESNSTLTSQYLCNYINLFDLSGQVEGSHDGDVYYNLLKPLEIEEEEEKEYTVTLQGENLSEPTGLTAYDKEGDIMDYAYGAGGSVNVPSTGYIEVSSPTNFSVTVDDTNAVIGEVELFYGTYYCKIENIKSNTTVRVTNEGTQGGGENPPAESRTIVSLEDYVTIDGTSMTVDFGDSTKWQFNSHTSSVEDLNALVGKTVGDDNDPQVEALGWVNSPQFGQVGEWTYQFQADEIGQTFYIYTFDENVTRFNMDIRGEQIAITGIYAFEVQETPGGGETPEPTTPPYLTSGQTIKKIENSIGEVVNSSGENKFKFTIPEVDDDYCYIAGVLSRNMVPDEIFNKILNYETAIVGQPVLDVKGTCSGMSDTDFDSYYFQNFCSLANISAPMGEIVESKNGDEKKVADGDVAYLFKVHKDNLVSRSTSMGMPWLYLAIYELKYELVNISDTCSHDWETKYDENNHYRQCVDCSEVKDTAAHTFANNVCSICGYEKVVTPPAHTHTFTEVPAKAATCTTAGNNKYYKCDCGKFFKDAEGTTETTVAAEVIPAAHSWVENAWVTDGTSHWHKCNNCTDKKDVVSHGDANADKACDVCGYKPSTTTPPADTPADTPADKPDTPADKPVEVEPEEVEKNELKINEGLKVDQKGSTIKAKWGKVSDADGYKVYAQYCGKNFKVTPNAVVKGAKNNTVTINKINGKKLDLKKNYKFYVVAYKIVDGQEVELGRSITAHIVGRKNTKYTNVKKVNVKKNKYTLKVNKTATINASTVLVSKNKKQLTDAHAKEFRYATSNEKVATVSTKGKIKAVGKGKCTIYVYARNGYCKKVSVTVK